MRPDSATDANSPLRAALDTSTWLSHDEEYVAASFWAMARRLPALLATAFRLACEASRRDTVLAVVLNLGAGTLTAVGVLATRGAAQALLASGPTPDRVRAALPSLVVVSVALGAHSALVLLARWARERLEPQVTAVVDTQLLDLTTSVELAAFDDPRFADGMARARVKGTEAARSVVDQSVDVLAGVVGVVAATVALFVVHPLLVPLLVLAVAPVGWAAVRAARIEYLSVRRRVSRRRRLWVLEELMANRHTAAELRAYAMRGFLLDQYRTVVAAETAADLDVVGRRTTAQAVGGAMAGLAGAGVYVALGWLLISGRVPLAAATAAVVALQAARQALALLTTAVNKVYESALYFGDYTDFRDQALARAPRRVPDVEVPPFSELTLDGVSLRYPGATTLAVDGVSMTLRRGETVALVGENGSGKTSLARLVAGLYAPTSGEIRWDGRPVAELPPDRLRSHVAVISQDYWRWPFTARDNIRVGDLARDPAHIHDAATATGAHEVIASLPHGYDTLLDRMFAGGHELSGGQWQRLAAARAVFRDAPLLICDEPSAALDARAEHALFRRLCERDERRTTILISHRLANVRHVDRIYLLAGGRVVEEGTHDELVAAGGRYAELFALQAAGYRAAEMTG
jgi:ATP-binding cassette subfamily B protein/ATP-binding cassette subfamily C protein